MVKGNNFQGGRARILLMFGNISDQFFVKCKIIIKLFRLEKEYITNFKYF